MTARSSCIYGLETSSHLFFACTIRSGCKPASSNTFKSEFFYSNTSTQKHITIHMFLLSMEKNYRDQWNKEEVAWGPEILLIPYSVLYGEYPRAGDSSEGKCLNTKHLLFPRHCELAVLTGAGVHVIFYFCSWAEGREGGYRNVFFLMSEEDLNILSFWTYSELSLSMFEFHYFFIHFFFLSPLIWAYFFTEHRLSGEKLLNKEKCSRNCTAELL